MKSLTFRNNNVRDLLAELKACSSTMNLEKGKKVHALAAKSGYHSSIFVATALVNMYAKCRSMADARQVFDNMKLRDVVSWTALISGYVDNGEDITAMYMFTKMKYEKCLPNSWTFVAALKACTSLALKEVEKGRVDWRNRGRQIHALASESGCSLDIYVQTTLVDMYAKRDSMTDARLVFDYMKHPDVVSWNAIILGYVNNGAGDTALHMFMKMRSQDYSPDSWTFVAVIKACGLLGALEFGRKIHEEFDNGIEIDLMLVNALVDFYAKCGSLVESQKVFDSHPRTRDLTTWNVLLVGHSRLGESKDVFRLFEEMQDAGFQPDGVTFTCILSHCSHAGLIGKGKEYFKAMSTRYGITPTAEHYTCMVDNLGRSNKLDDAMSLLKNMPCKPDAVAWMTVLSGCYKWKNVETGRMAFKYLMSCDVKNVAAYVLMGHIYGSSGMWREQNTVMGEITKLEARK